MAPAKRKAGTKRKGAQRGGKRTTARSGSSLWLWITALAAVAGGIALYDNLPSARRLVAGLAGETPQRLAQHPEVREKPVAARTRAPDSERIVAPVPPRPVGAPDRVQTAAIIPPASIGRPDMRAGLQPAPQFLPDRKSGGLAGAFEARFFLCGTAKQDDCVVSADRFVFHGQKIRLVGVEVPNIRKPRCEAERIKASDAKLRARAFLDSGPFDLVTWQGNDADVDGHKLRDVTRNGRSLADVLVSEGLAKRPGAGKSGWCS
jgi:endonuclease YncB( thermonuclease family)